MSSLIGKRFGNYQILELLGEGGMASVYRAQHLMMKREIALKIIKTELADADQFIKRFEREAQTVANLSHPHILKIFEYGHHKTSPFLAMELLTGGNLSGLMREGPLPLDAISRILGQVCAALDYAHGLSIVHRDLKPQNVMLDSNGNAILTDFGLAKMMSGGQDAALTQTGMQMGTPNYMSPEQWRADPVDARSDVYALGVMLYEMLTGVPVYKGETPYDLMHKHLFVAPPSIREARADLPAPVEVVVGQALAKNPDDRYPAAGALYQAFQSALNPAAGQTQFVKLTPDEPITLTVSDSQAAAQEQAAIARLEAEQHGQTKTVTPTGRFIGALPQDVSGRFVGRAKPTADVTNLLLEKTRLVSIYGRGGVGKTALACKVLTDFQASGGADAIVPLSAASGAARLDRILMDFGRALGGEDRTLLESLARDGNLPAPQKAAVLLEKLHVGRYILLLDGLEAIQNQETGELVDPDLKLFLETALEQGGALRILITSREPLALPRALKTWERLIPLDDGLPEAEAIALLRAFDPDGAAGLRDAPDDQLRSIAQKAGGFPRALEAIAGLLLEDPLLSVDDLIQDAGLVSGEIAPLIVQQAISRLGSDAVRVMEALAVFDRPVNQTALDFLLAPYLNIANLRGILARLVRTYFATFNKATQQFALHPLDRDYCYAHIPTTGSYNRIALHERAAEYFRMARKPPNEWRSVDDLMPQLAEFDHRIATGDYDEAARVLLLIDRDYLWEWGQRPLLNEMHARVRGHIRDRQVAHQNLRRIAWLKFFISLSEAVPLFQELLDNARQAGDRQAEADALDDLAQTRRAVMDLMGGFQLHQQALDIYREMGDRRGQADSLGGMGACASYTAPESALQYLQEAEGIQRELNNLPSLGYLWRVLGGAHSTLGHFDQAVAYFQDTIRLAEDTHNFGNLTAGLIELAQVYANLGDFDRALECGRRAVGLAREMVGASGLTLYASALMGLIQATAGDVDGGITTLNQFFADARDTASAFTTASQVVLSSLLLIKGDLPAVARLFETIRDGETPPSFRPSVGVIWARLGQTERAIEVFQQALGVAQAISGSYEALYAQALSLAGLGLLNGDEGQIEAAVDTYRQARARVHAPGYQRRELNMLDALMQCPGGEVLAPARAALAE